MKKLLVLSTGDATLPALGKVDEPTLKGLATRGVDILAYPGNTKALGDNWDKPIAMESSAVTGPHDWIYVFGDHGDFRVLDKRDPETPRSDGYGPAALNGRRYAAMKKLVDELAKRSVKARVILLDSCWSAGFIPLFSKILADNGHTMAYFCAAPQFCYVGLKRILKEESLNLACVKAFEAELEERDDSLAGGILSWTTRAALVKVCHSKRHNTVFRDRNFGAIFEGYLTIDQEDPDDQRRCVAHLETYLRENGLTIEDVPSIEMQRRMTTIAWGGVHDNLPDPDAKRV